MPEAGEERPQVALVAGGGIGGLTAALALHKAGLRVHVFEQAPAPAEVGAGINLLPGGVKVLHDLGLAEALRSTGVEGGAGVETSELVYCAPSGTVILREKRGLAAGCDAPQYSIHRGWLHRMLLHAVHERLGRANVHCGHHLLDFAQDLEGVTANFAVAADKGERFGGAASVRASYRGDILIGADGLKSKVRAQLYPSARAKFTGWRIYRGVVEVDTQFYDGKSMLLYGHSKAASVLYPVCERRRREGKTLLNWGINCQDEVLKPHLRGEPGVESWTRRVRREEFDHIVEGWTFPKGAFPDPGLDFSALIAQTPADSVTCYALFDRDPAARWTLGRVTLLGDAAHPLLPFGSQGAGQALLDVEALYGAVVASPDDLPEALRSYEAARAAPAARVVLQNRRMGPTQLLKMFEDAVGGEAPEAQERWVREHEQDIVDFSRGYQGLSGLFRGTPAPAASSAVGRGTPFDGRVGFGGSPALLVVDFCQAYTTPGSIYFCGDARCGVVAAVSETVPLLAKAREKGLPVFFTRVLYSRDGSDDGLVFLRKVPQLRKWTEDNPQTSICPEVAPVAGEEVLAKKHPSAFFETPLRERLRARGVDTLLLVGCSTSGCIRATALEGMQHGLRVIIPRECVGDRTQAVHDANLLDCDAKICDVAPKAEVLGYLEALPPPAKRAATLRGGYAAQAKGA